MYCLFAICFYLKGKRETWQEWDRRIGCTGSHTLWYAKAGVLGGALAHAPNTSPSERRKELKDAFLLIRYIFTSWGKCWLDKM